MFQSLKWWPRSLLASLQICRPAPAYPMLGLALTAALGIAPAVFADVVRVTPRIVVVEKDSTPMRCASGVPFYIVNTLKADQKLRVDGEEGAWLRVEYLTDMLAFVKAEDALPEPDGKTVRLTRASRLAAVNDRGNERGHWWFLLDTPLPSDSCLRVQETIKAMNEVTLGYLVVAPAQSRGYVKADSVRNATKDEAIAFQGRTDVEAPQLAAATSSPAGSDAQQPVAAATSDTGAASPASEAVAPVEVVVYDMPTLKARYTQVMALKGDEARKQIPVALAEFKRTAATLGSSSEDRQNRAAIDWYTSALQLRQEILSTLKQYSPEGAIASSAPTRQ
jgi:hypothetical protein